MVECIIYLIDARLLHLECIRFSCLGLLSMFTTNILLPRIFGQFSTSMTHACEALYYGTFRDSDDDSISAKSGICLCL